MKRLVNVDGIHCKSCKILIEDICGEIDGIKSCKVDLAKNSVELDYSSDLALEIFKKEVESIGGYKVKL